MKITKQILFQTLFLATLAVNSHAAAKSREVVVYCALDQPYSEPVFRSFEKETGIHVKSVYDSETVKTTGLVNRLLAEKERPQCDVFWNNEKLRMVILARRGALEKYEPAAWKERNLPHDEKDGLWTEFAARARVMVYNPKFAGEILGDKTVAGVGKKSGSSGSKTGSKNSELRARLEMPDETSWLVQPPALLKGRIAMAYPLFGTTSTHFLGWMNEERKRGADVKAWLQRIFDNRPLICSGNSDVVRRVASGEAWLGFTDSDDAMVAMERGEAVDFYFPQRSPDQASAAPAPSGTLLIPNTVAIIRAAPHRAEAEKFVGYLLREATELALANGPSRQIPLGEIRDPKARAALPFTSGAHRLKGTRSAHEEDLMKTYEVDLELLRKIFHR